MNRNTKNRPFQSKSHNNTHPPSLTGTVQRQADGFGFVIPEDPAFPDVYLPRQQMQGVMSQDKVKVAVFPKKYRKNKWSGKVLKILSRREPLVMGPCFPLSDKTGLIRDDSAEWGEDLKVDLKKNQKIKKGEWVQAKILYWPASPEGFRGELVHCLGTFPSTLEDNMRVIQKHNLPAVFSQEVLKEAQNLSPPSPPPSPRRKDLSSLPFVTIDGQTAQDFDDAVYVETCPKGWILYVAIADVSHYVRPGSALDRSARERGNSTYFPGWTVPMLPEQLSNNLCSLKPDVPRLVFVVEIHFNSQAQKTKSFFYEGLIQSQARLTYGEAEDIIEQNQPKGEVQQNVVAAGILAQKLLAKRIKNHFIFLEIPETEVHVNALGEPLDIKQSRRLFSHQLIEELMLSANMAVAGYLNKQKAPALYRIHNLPKEDSLKLLGKFAQSLGFKAQLKEGNLHKNISALIAYFADHPLSEVLQMLILRSLSQAVYSAQVQGHFGLNIRHYTHFTSPIRRYSDLIVHRILKASLYNKSTYPYRQKDLESLAPLISACEQRAVKAERHLKDIKKARFIKKHLGEEMEGKIAGLTRFGFFVKLRLYDVEGLVSLNQLAGHWEFEESLLELRSADSPRRFKLGDLVLVQVVSADISTAQIDFDLITHKGEKVPMHKKDQKKRKNLRQRSQTNRQRSQTDRQRSQTDRQRSQTDRQRSQTNRRRSKKSFSGQKKRKKKPLKGKKGLKNPRRRYKKPFQNPQPKKKF